MKQTVEEAAREAIHKHYKCNGEYPCTERNYCEHFKGSNPAYDCGECGADEFKEGFIAGAEWQSKRSLWISVEERLPEEDELVLCRMVSNGAIVSGFINPISGCQPQVSTLPDFLFEDYSDYVCDMWMPIPSFDQILEANKDVLQRMKEK